MEFLKGLRILNLAYNAPGPAAARRLQGWGAEVIKIEPPGGDPLVRYCRAWYEDMIVGQTVVTLDLKQAAGRAALEDWLAKSDLLITSVRLESLERLGLAWEALHARHAQLCQIAITGYPAPDDGRPGHDLTFQAEAGLLEPPGMPRTLVADLAGAERAASAGLALLLGRARGLGANYLEVPLSEATEAFSTPWKYGMTGAEGILGGIHPGYRIYPAREGWIAVAALEEAFWKRLIAELGLPSAPTIQQVGEIFLGHTASDWQTWAEERGLPIVVVW